MSRYWSWLNFNVANNKTNTKRGDDDDLNFWIRDALLEDDLHAGEQLLSTGNDLFRWQEESVETGVPQLGGEGVTSSETASVPIVTGSGGGVLKNRKVLLNWFELNWIELALR